MLYRSLPPGYHAPKDGPKLLLSVAKPLNPLKPKVVYRCTPAKCLVREIVVRWDLTPMPSVGVETLACPMCRANMRAERFVELERVEAVEEKPGGE